MQKKVWLSSAMAALGAAMLVAAAFAGPASSKSNRPSASGQKKGGTMNVNASGTDVDYIDPSLAYGTLSWQILDSVCVKLMYYPDKPDPVGAKLAPDGAVGPVVLELQLVLCRVAQRYRLELVPEHVPTPEPLVTLRPKGGLPMRVRARAPLSVVAPGERSFHAVQW